MHELSSKMQGGYFHGIKKRDALVDLLRICTTKCMLVTHGLAILKVY
jgi:hypothetical protein